MSGRRVTWPRGWGARADHLLAPGTTGLGPWVVLRQVGEVFWETKARIPKMKCGRQDAH